MGRIGLAITAALTLIIGVTMLVYPSAAQWVSQYNQSKVTENYSRQIDDTDGGPEQQILAAQSYNHALSAGALVGADQRIPTSEERPSDDMQSIIPYGKQLMADDYGLMARIRIPSINVDLPVYHGTSDQILLQGAGHLEGTSLPVGGSGTRSVITGHSGLAQARMFTDLDRVQSGDIFSVETFGEVFTYRVFEKIVVDPSDSESIRAIEGRDLATLITCTPLGLNTHRIVLTGERIYPTEEETAATMVPVGPGFPWWAVIWGGAVIIIISGAIVLTREPKKKGGDVILIHEGGAQIE
ncbi:MAG: class C sortase [Actinomycetaceae bacterium]|nr:class C sortase [Actinomycetaceae bacterium]